MMHFNNGKTISYPISAFLFNAPKREREVRLIPENVLYSLYLLLPYALEPEAKVSKSRIIDKLSEVYVDSLKALDRKLVLVPAKCTRLCKPELCL